MVFGENNGKQLAPKLVPQARLPVWPSRSCCVAGLQEKLWFKKMPSLVISGSILYKTFIQAEFKTLDLNIIKQASWAHRHNDNLGLSLILLSREIMEWFSKSGVRCAKQESNLIIYVSFLFSSLCKYLQTLKY